MRGRGTRAAVGSRDGSMTLVMTGRFVYAR